MIAEGLSRSGISAHVFTATEYGGALVQKLPHIQVYSERLNAEEMRRFMTDQGITRVVDATHPYARVVTENIIQAVREAGVEYIRLVREEESFANHKNIEQKVEPETSQEREQKNGQQSEQLSDSSYLSEEKIRENTEEKPDKKPNKKTGDEPEFTYGTTAEKKVIIRVANSAEAVAYLATTQGPVLLTTGSKELDIFCSLPDFQNRLFVRVLPMPQVIERCFSLGFGGRQIIAMQGPFSHALNVALLEHYGCRYLVTKNTSQVGGMDEKISAALATKVQVVLIERPVQEKGLTLDEVFSLLGITKE